MTVHAMTIDAEDWFQVGAYEGGVHRSEWARYPSRIEANVETILALLAGANVKASFFFLGWIAERYPSLVRQVAGQGHEIASHGCQHHRVHDLGPQGFAQDVARAKALLEDISGHAVQGYRAPNFSISAKTNWAHAILAEQGYAYSSSVAPFAHDHYGWPGSPTAPWFPVAGQDFVEFPISTSRLFDLPIPCGGGGFFRLYPYSVTRWLLRRADAGQGPIVFYIHPWEFDPDQPVPKGVSWHARARHNVNSSRVAGRFEKLLGDFSWTRLDALAACKRGAHL